MIGGGNWIHVREALRHRDHRLFNITLLPALICLWAQRTGIGWLTWELTHSPTWLGIIAAADLLPAVFLSPFAGVIADRVNAVRMMRLTQGIIMVHALVLWTMTATGVIEIWSLFFLSVLAGINQPFSTAARMVFYPTLVPKRDLATAIAINSSIFNLGRVLGPALAGLLIAPLGVAALFLLNCAAFLAHLVNMYRIQGMYAERVERKPKSVLREARDGLTYAARHTGIAPMLLLLIVSSIMSRPVQEMLPGFADVVFARGAEGLGWLLSAMGAGGLIGAVWLTQRGPVRGLTGVVVLLTLLMGLSMIAFALVGSFWVALGCIIVLGFTQVVTGTGTQSLLQTAVAPEVRGRVMSIYTLVWRGMPAIGAILMGWIAEQVGLSWTVAGAGLICVLAWGWARTLQRRMGPALEGEPSSHKPKGG